MNKCGGGAVRWKGMKICVSETAGDLVKISQIPAGGLTGAE